MESWKTLFAAKRNPVPEHLVDRAVVPGHPEARYWADETIENARARAELLVDRLRSAGRDEERISWLGISGGGANGAFGAGLLNGWTAHGTRPWFQGVVGISTGALSAPLAFLGPEWDGELETIYTKYATKDVLKRRSLLSTITSDAMADSSPLASVIAHHVDQRMLDAVAGEFAKGRTLNICTTNIDTMRPVVWRMGDLAASGAPGSLDLFRKVMLASASIPGAFPPVRIEVEVDGERYDELHVDGGTVSQLFMYPFALRMGELLERHGIRAEMYLIRNAHETPRWQATPQSVLPILERSISSLIRAQGHGDLYRCFLAAKRDGIGFNLASMPQDFREVPAEQFDLVYMRKLFDMAYDLAEKGYPWSKEPRGYGGEVLGEPAL